MEISYKAGSETVRDGSGAFILTGSKSYFTLGGDSQYQGWVVDDYKLLANLYREAQPRRIVNRYSLVTREYPDGDESFYLTGNALHYNHAGPAIMELDCRPIHEFDDNGRIYEFEQRPGDITLIRYTKHATDQLEEQQHERYIAVKGAKVQPRDWTHRRYGYDETRNARSEFYTFQAALEPTRETVVFGQGTTAEQAIRTANRRYRKKRSTPTFDNMVTGTAMHGLRSLQHEDALYAGLPWFDQHWHRDHLVSLSGYRATGQHWRVKDVLENALSNVHQDGWMRNHTSNDELRSADATGWLFYQLHELMKNRVYELFSTEELENIAQLLDIITEGVTSQHYRNGLVANGPLETWMDTAKDGRSREGCRVEVQALYARMFRFGRYLSRFVETGKDYTMLEENLRKNTRHYLYDDMLWDGYDTELDDTVRPNVFLAYLVYPQLLDDEEWKDVFDRALEELWLDWGGLASISTGHAQFTDEYTGQTNESYHFGDSWYYINNFAAVAMHRLGHRYEDHARHIYEASVEEMFTTGYMGRCAEVSSACERRSEGCRLQAWSCASLLALQRELF